MCFSPAQVAAIADTGTPDPFAGVTIIPPDLLEVAA
jgi:hypothetical protein